MNMSVMFLITVSVFIISVALPLFHYAFTGYSESKKIILADLLLKYSLFFNIGFLFLIGFLGQIFYSEQIANCLGWKWSEFQYELAFSELSLALLGLFAVLFGFEFWLATALAASFWLIGASSVHIATDIFFNTSAVSQSANIVYFNVIISIWLLFLCWHSYKQRSHKGIFLNLIQGNSRNLKSKLNLNDI